MPSKRSPKVGQNLHRGRSQNTGAPGRALSTRATKRTPKPNVNSLGSFSASQQPIERPKASKRQRNTTVVPDPIISRPRTPQQENEVDQVVIPSSATTITISLPKCTKPIFDPSVEVEGHVQRVNITLKVFFDSIEYKNVVACIDVNNVFENF